jgi:putative endonuclease
MRRAAPTGRDRKLQARGFGRRGEWAALALLLVKRYRILARNFSAPGGEIDLVASRGETIVFVEVKARPEVEAARTAISMEKRQRIGRAARAWISHNRWSTGYNFRGDAVFVSRSRWPEHLEDAFELDLM